jgi:hypothetical protein
MPCSPRVQGGPTAKIATPRDALEDYSKESYFSFFRVTDTSLLEIIPTDKVRRKIYVRIFRSSIATKI